MGINSGLKGLIRVWNFMLFFTLTGSAKGETHISCLLTFNLPLVTIWGPLKGVNLFVLITGLSWYLSFTIHLLLTLSGNENKPFCISGFPHFLFHCHWPVPGSSPLPMVVIGHFPCTPPSPCNINCAKSL